MRAIILVRYSSHVCQVGLPLPVNSAYIYGISLEVSSRRFVEGVCVLSGQKLSHFVTSHTINMRGSSPLSKVVQLRRMIRFRYGS